MSAKSKDATVYGDDACASRRSEATGQAAAASGLPRRQLYDVRAAARAELGT